MISKIARHTSQFTKTVFALASVTLVVMVPDWRISLAAEEEICDNVADYAEKCYERMNMTKDDLKGPFMCKAGTPLLTTVDGQPANVVFPEACDRPAWLNDKCYGNSYIQQVIDKNNVKGALLCRHKNVPNDGDKTFDDVAMILHNSANGQTCWFQQLGSNQDGLDGTAVPAPHTEEAKTYWMKPSTTAAINCIKCHDNGPWMNSRWLNDTISSANGFSLKDSHGGRYINEGVFFDRWKKPMFVKDDGTCTRCHKIHIKQTTTGTSPQPYRSCIAAGDQNATDSWILRATGQAFSPASNNFGRSYDIAFWMPSGKEHPPTKGEWVTEFSGALTTLLACCTAQGNNVAECASFDPNQAAPAPIPPNLLQRLSPAAPLNTVQISASLNRAPLSAPQFTSIAPAPGSEHVVRPGTFLTVGWAAAETTMNCSITAKLPPGIEVRGSQTPSISTATNWVLNDPPQTLGPLVAPGAYRFEISCDPGPENTTSLTFVVPGTPRTFLNIQAITNNTAGPAATNFQARHTRSTANVTDSVYIYWRAFSARENTCRFTETIDLLPNTTSFNDSGFFKVTLQAAKHQNYSLTCQEESGVWSTVTTTLSVP